MFKVLILQAMHSLSDERTEFLIRDRLSFMRFLGLGLADPVPDANTIWTFREALKKADDGVPRTVAPIEEVQLYVRDAAGKRVDVSLRDLIDQKMGAKIARADLFLTRFADPTE